jgi:hypothetical protein
MNSDFEPSALGLVSGINTETFQKMNPTVTLRGSDTTPRHDLLF